MAFVREGEKRKRIEKKQIKSNNAEEAKGTKAATAHKMAERDKKGKTGVAGQESSETKDVQLPNIAQNGC